MSLVEKFLSEIVEENDDIDIAKIDEDETVMSFIDSEDPFLNMVLSGRPDGGLEEGRVTVLAGEQQSGKTLLSIFFAKKFLEKYPNGEVIYFDSEGRVGDAMFRNIIGKENINRLTFVSVSTVTELNTLLLKFKEKLDGLKNKDEVKVMFVLDSLGNLSSRKEMDDATDGSDKADFTRPKEIKKLFRTITIPLIYKYNIPFIVINHLYDVVGSFVSYKKMSGGSGIHFIGNTILYMKREKVEEDDKSFIVEIRVWKSLNVVKDVKFVFEFNNNKYTVDWEYLLQELGVIRKVAGKDLYNVIGDLKNKYQEQYTISALTENKDFVNDIIAMFKEKYVY